MGVVLAAYDEELDRKIALKLLRQSVFDGTEGPVRMQREAQALARLSHPNVVQVYDLEYTLKHARIGRIQENMASGTCSKPACAGSISGSILNPCRH